MDSCTVVEVELELRLLFFLPLPRNSYVNKIEFVCLCVCVCVCFFTLGRFQNSACSFSEVVVRVVHIGCSCFSPQEQEEKLAPAVFLALFHQLFICLAKWIIACVHWHIYLLGCSSCGSQLYMRDENGKWWGKLSRERLIYREEMFTIMQSGRQMYRLYVAPNLQIMAMHGMMMVVLCMQRWDTLHIAGSGRPISACWPFCFRAPPGIVFVLLINRHSFCLWPLWAHKSVS